MDDDVPSQPAAIFERKKSVNFRVVYSNEFRYRVSLTDIGLVFGNQADIGEGARTLVTTDEVLVQMPLGQAKALAEYLTMIVARYERTLGPIMALGKEPPIETELDSMFGILENVGLH